ncbi:uncharacterized protein LOC127708798 [Mytilus californianus]|uniref:uncharacterized protein LOC127708798 n=1 Tax=Mytilus californianus TaxID=6549 RepID=UPI0022463E5D|nr:uncharacterized protein LOC127708798 [Mytilus californianus]
MLYTSLIIILIICFKEIVTLQLSMSNTTTTISSNNTILTCSYILEKDEILTVGIKAYNKSSNTFEHIAGYRPHQAAELLTNGAYLYDRVALSNITQTSTQALIVFHEVKCIDETLYKCIITYLDKDLKQLTAESLEAYITITVPAYDPDSLSITDTFTSPTEGENVTFVCKGNLGKNPSKFIWRKKLRGDSVTDTYTNEKTSYTQLEESCSYVGRSSLTITLYDMDNQATIGCAEETLMNDDEMYKYTPPIDIFFKVRNPSIMKYLNRSTYLEGIEIIDLTCISNGNPPPTYLWYFKGTYLDAGSVLKIKNGRESDSGLYTCNASNSFHETFFEASNSVDILITKTEHSSPSSTNYSSIEVPTIVAVLCGLLVVIIIFLVTWIFHNHKCRHNKKNNNSTELNNQELNTYDTIDDISSYEKTGPLDQRPYNEMDQISIREDCEDENRRNNKNNDPVKSNNQEIYSYDTIDDQTSYERPGPLNQCPNNEIFQISKTEDFEDENRKYMTVVSEIQEKEQETIIQIPEDLTGVRHSYTNLQV